MPYIAVFWMLWLGRSGDAKGSVPRSLKTCLTLCFMDFFLGCCDCGSFTYEYEVDSEKVDGAYVLEGMATVVGCSVWVFK